MSKIANFIYKRIILSILLLLFIYPICIYAQDEVKVYFNETQINEIIATIIDARGFNFGDYTGDFISDAYFGNIDGATIDIHNNSNCNNTC